MFFKACRKTFVAMTYFKYLVVFCLLCSFVLFYFFAFLKNPIKFSSFKNSEFNCTQYGILSIEYHVTNANEISKEIKNSLFLKLLFSSNLIILCILSFSIYYFSDLMTCIVPSPKGLPESTVIK